MLGKIAGVARSLAIVVAIVAGIAAGVVAIPSLNIALVLLFLGLIAGLIYTEETITRLILTVLVLPAVAVALAIIPEIGSYLAAIASNIALAATGATATALAIRIFNLVRGDITGFAK